MERSVVGPLAALAVAGLLATPATAAQLAAASLADLDLEQLANIEVTSATKRVQRLSEVADSLFVISAEDIRRSGATSLPEVLRLAPNLHVARADANQYAITARGFNSVLANKMLVLIDGRTVYSPLFSGVFWETQDLVLEDIERIEVLSGAAGTLWGSNAVNGVISIVTRPPADTQGLLLSAGVGNEDRTAVARWGNGSGGTAWRAYAKHVRRDNMELTSGAPIRDAARRHQAGFRLEQRDSRAALRVQGDVYESTIDQAPAARRVRGVNLLARRTTEEGTDRTAWQVYYDRSERDQPGTIHDTLDTFDVEYQRQLQPRPGHDLLWGAGWRHHRDRATNIAPQNISFQPAHRSLNLWNVFVQDEIALRPGAWLTVGAKAEHNSYTGLEWLPSARLAWQVAPDHLAWVSASRAVRTPARIDRDIVTPVFAGGAQFDSEVARVYEAGLRGQPFPRLSYSATLFHHDFDRLRSVDLTSAGVTFNNNFRARLTGLEGWARWRASDRLRLQAGYVHQKLRPSTAPGSAPLQPASSLGNDPRYRATFGVAWDIGAALELDVNVRRIGALPAPQVPAYTGVDMRLGWRPRSDLELSLSVRNALDSGHPEWGVATNRAEFGRSVLLQATWRM